MGTVGSPYETGFRITAPGPGNLFPAGGNAATAEIKVFGIQKIAGADGISLLEPVNVPLNSSLGQLIVAAFLINPSTNTFSPGGSTWVDVTVSNPCVDPADYGDYVVTVKCQAKGSGIGVGSGSRLTLSLRAATDTDTMTPNVTINNPINGNSYILGPISVDITAKDLLPGTGVVSISAAVSSVGGAVNQATITLTTDTPKAAGVDATGTGSFTPFGGDGYAGTTLNDAFTGTTPSGIGSYILTAKAVDGAGNEGSATSGFQVKYNVEFTQQHVGGTTAQFKFEVKRSSSVVLQ